MTKHTPGPWRYSDQGVGPRGKSLGIIVCTAKGLPMFFMPRGKEELVANARLVAAAPELLEALKEVVAISDRKTDAWDRAHAAIVKAEGKADGE